MAHLEAAGPLGEVRGQQLRHRNLVFGSFGQRNTDRVADAVGQQSPDAHGALHAPFQPVAGLGDPQMDRIAHPLGLHRFDQQAVGRHHHARVARLHRNDHPVEPLPPADAQELHGRDDHPLRRVAPLVENALGQRTVVDPDAQGDAPFAALRDQSFELTVVRAVVARIDAHLVDVSGGDGRRLGQEVDVGDQRGVDALLAHAAGDGLQVFGLAPPLRRETHDAAAGRGDAGDLPHARFGVVGIGVGHRLHRHRIRSADLHAADGDLVRLAPHKFVEIHWSSG